MHSLLTRQIKEALGDIEVTQMTKAWQRFFALVDQAYYSGDEERTILNRSLEISSREFTEVRSKLMADITQKDAELELIKVTSLELSQKLAELGKVEGSKQQT